MATAMDMSLDDIISSNKQKRRGDSSRGRRGGGGGRGRGDGNRRDKSKPYSVDKPSLLKGSAQDKLMVSNLDFKVTSKDARELFSKIGPIKSLELNCDEKGRSKGTCTVVFQKRGDAARAVKEYNNRTLDGRAMKIELVVTADAASGLLGPNRNGGSRGGGPDRRGSSRGGRGGRGRGRGGAREKPQQKSASELDAEMDSYMKDEEMT